MEGDVPATPIELKLQYLQIKPIARRFCDELVRQLQSLLGPDTAALAFPIQSRVKTWESISDKLRRKALKLDAIADLHDLIGIRLVFLFRPDAERFASAIPQKLSLVSTEDTRSRLGAGEFGYSSLHLVVKLPDTWLVVPTLADFAALQAELQVRTIAQHLWASASHLLQYKTEDSVPPPVRRSIHRVSALLETVDKEFEDVLSQREIYRRDLASTSEDAPLDADSLELLLDSLLPSANKDQYEDYSDLLLYLRLLEISTSGELRRLLTTHMDTILRREAEILAERAEEGDFVDDDEEYRVTELGVFFTHVGLVRVALDEQFGAQWFDTVLKAISAKSS